MYDKSQNKKKNGQKNGVNKNTHLGYSMGLFKREFTDNCESSQTKQPPDVW